MRDLDDATRERALTHVREAVVQLERLRTILDPDDQRQRAVTEALTGVWMVYLRLEPPIFEGWQADSGLDRRWRERKVGIYTEPLTLERDKPRSGPMKGQYFAFVQSGKPGTPPGDVTRPVESANALVYMVGGRLACFWPKIGTWKPAGNQVHAAIYGDSFDTTVKVTESQAATILRRLAPGAKLLDAR